MNREETFTDLSIKSVHTTDESKYRATMNHFFS